MKDFLTPYIGEFITGLIALVLGWFGKGKIQKRSDNADLTAKIQSIYKELVSDADSTVDSFRARITSLEKRFTESEKHWQMKVDELKKKQIEIDENWKKKIVAVEKKWQTKYNALKTEFHTYKKNHP